ncbi:MAG: hypothetical protein QW838_02980 [Candidatus Nitrosotenuis sp.]
MFPPDGLDGLFRGNLVKITVGDGRGRTTAAMPPKTQENDWARPNRRKKGQPCPGGERRNPPVGP